MFIDGEECHIARYKSDSKIQKEKMFRSFYLNCIESDN